MTTLELFQKHRKGEVSRERFLYEVRRDNNLPWITNVTSYNDAVKILKNKGIIREAYENIATDPAVDRVNPYYLKRGVQKDLANEPEFKDDSYIKALNKNAKKLASDPKAFHGEMFGNYDTVQKADAKLQMTPVKKNNFVDEDNGMKKVKGQETPKAMSAPTGENKKTTKPEGVTVMKDKGVEGSEKVIKEIAAYIKKKLNENSYHDFHEGMEVETAQGTAVVKEINGGTLTVETKDGKRHDIQMNTAKHYTEKKKNEAFEDKKEESLKEYNEEDQPQPDYYINVSLRDASRAIEIYRDINIIPRGAVKLDGTDSYVIDDLEIAQELLNAFQEEDIEIIDTDVPAIDSEYDMDYEEDLDEAGAAVYTQGGDYVKGFKNASDAQKFSKTVTLDTGTPTKVKNIPS